jgi:hypothetical protein
MDSVPHDHSGFATKREHPHGEREQKHEGTLPVEYHFNSHHVEYRFFGGLLPPGALLPPSLQLPPPHTFHLPPPYLLVAHAATVYLLLLLLLLGRQRRQWQLPKGLTEHSGDHKLNTAAAAAAASSQHPSILDVQ